MKTEKIIDRLGDKLYNYLTIKLGSLQDAEDVPQEVFYRVIKYSVRLKLKRNPSAYLFQIARNEAVNHIKKRKKDLNIRHSKEELSRIIQQSLRGTDPERLNRVSDALAQIPDDQREVIVLKFFEELTFKEIARVTCPHLLYHF
ncbi:MAG: sigma-70 family RNA polymerase sigma factor [Candidatus Aminicenantes bacterium]|nr:sigma-70 family RNA polymerase sigma factor [Candidatus Aminicenantes bacterium]